MTEEFWGFRRSSVDNPGDSKIVLDLVFREREGMSRTGERTQTGAERPSLSSRSFGVDETENGPGPRGGSGSGRSEKPHCFEAPSRRATGGHGRRGDRAEPSEHPNCELGQCPAASNDGTGNRVSVNGVEGPTGPGNRQTGVPSPGVEIGQPIETNGRHRHRETDVAPRGNGRWATSEPGLDSGDGGWETSRRGRGGNRRRETGVGGRTAAGPGNRSTGRKRASPAETPWGSRRAM